jgi:hypothetical protein
VFVSAVSGDDSRNGTPDQPVKTLKRAIALALQNKGWVYACAESFDEAVEVPAGISLFGGLYCASTPSEGQWKYIGNQARTELTANPEQIPLVLQGGGMTRIEDFEVIAKPALNPGGSSIAAVVDGATAELVRCTFEAGDGKDGAPGASSTGAAKNGVQGGKGGDACSAVVIAGGLSVSSMCGNPDSSSGYGGDGFEDGVNAGDSGLPGTTMNGGAGETSTTLCKAGTDGATGVAGAHGEGATDLGTISKSGYAGVAGSAGTAGGPGQGGGGGGSAKGGKNTGGATDKCSATTPGGAAGGSGGSGGCGGAPGQGGGPGGASIALISLNATLTLTKVILRTGNGGKGGDGGQGQAGGMGAPGGKGGGVDAAMTSLHPACDGGAGGAGGKGGQGGGGRGGHAIGLAYVGQSMPAVEDVFFSIKGVAGSGGKGADMAHSGVAGVQVYVQAFP